MKKDFNPEDQNENPEDSADKDIKKSFGKNSRRPEGDDDDPESPKKKSGPEWEQTTDGSEEEPGQDDTITNILTDQPEFPDGPLPPPINPPTDDPPPPPPDGPEFVSNVIAFQRPKNAPPPEEVMVHLIQHAINQGWDKIYIFDRQTKKPDLKMAKYLQKYIEKNGPFGHLCCCCDRAEYKEAGSAAKVLEDNARSGARTADNIKIN